MMAGPTYLLVVFDEGKEMDIKNGRTKYIPVSDYGLLKENWTKEVWLDEALYQITDRRVFTKDFSGIVVNFLILDVQLAEKKVKGMNVYEKVKQK